MAPTFLNNPHVGVQDTPPVSHSRQVTILEPPSTSQSRRVSIQEPLPVVHGRRVSIQEPGPVVHGRRVSIQEPGPVVRGRRVSIQEPGPVVRGRRVSIQEPPFTSQSHRLSIQGPQAVVRGRRVSTQEPPFTSQSRRVSFEDPLPVSQSHWMDIHDIPSAIFNRRMSNRESVFQNRYLSSQNALTPSSLLDLEPFAQRSTLNTESLPSPTEKPEFGTSGLQPLPEDGGETSFTSVTPRPRDSVKNLESFTSENASTLPQQTLPESNIHSLRPVRTSGSETFRAQHRSSRHYSLLPIGWRLLHEARKISRMVSLAMSLAGIVIISLISLGQPWIHFQVPLRPPGDPAGPKTIPINTVLFVRCSDISCLREYDQNAYLLDCAWLFFISASITGFFVCLTLLYTIFFNSSSLSMLDFSLFIASTLTGASMILGVLFYLLQAQEYLQEGMTYKLACSFYLAWTGIFFFLMTGFISYMNYINFWSILAIQAIWS